MMGKDIVGGPSPQDGIIPRFCRDLFERIDVLKESEEFMKPVSLFMIYLERFL